MNKHLKDAQDAIDRERARSRNKIMRQTTAQVHLNRAARVLYRAAREYAKALAKYEREKNRG